MGGPLALGLRGLSSALEALPSAPLLQPPLQPGLSWPEGTLGLEEGQATPKALLQELHIRGCGRVFKGGREAEDIVLNILGLHGGDIQEVVGVDVVDLGEGLGEESERAPTAPGLLMPSWEQGPLSGLDCPHSEADGRQAEQNPTQGPAVSPPASGHTGPSARGALPHSSTGQNLTPLRLPLAPTPHGPFLLCSCDP